MELNKTKTAQNTKYFLTQVIGQYFVISCIEQKQLFSNQVVNDYLSPRVIEDTDLINLTIRIINAVNDAYNALDDKLKPFIKLTAKNFTNTELVDYFNMSLSQVNKYKKQAFIKFAINLENSKITNNCTEFTSLVVYKE